MNTRTRDTLALFAIASLAILAVLYADDRSGPDFHRAAGPVLSVRPPLGQCRAPLDGGTAKF